MHAVDHAGCHCVAAMEKRVRDLPSEAGRDVDSSFSEGVSVFQKEMGAADRAASARKWAYAMRARSNCTMSVGSRHLGSRCPLRCDPAPLGRLSDQLCRHFDRTTTKGGNHLIGWAVGVERRRRSRAGMSCARTPRALLRAARPPARSGSRPRRPRPFRQCHSRSVCDTTWKD